MAEEYFSRLRRAEIGIHHHIAGAYLLRYAQESSWREDNRRVANWDQVNRIAGLASVDSPVIGSVGNQFVFPGGKRSKPLSETSLEAVLERMEVDATPHGFRSSFRDWAGDATSFPREIAEAALAHIVGDKVERAYRRGDALEKRRMLMEAWQTFCEDDRPPRRSLP